jgi:hypothetical protein
MEVDDQHRFTGWQELVAFTSSCDRPDGWVETCQVRLTVEASDSGMVLALSISPGTKVPLWRGLSTAALLYLADRNPPYWLRSWDVSVQTPRAVGVVVNGDTIIVRVGARE